MPDGFAIATGAIGELFFNVNDAVVIARPDRALTWNPAAAALFGVDAPGTGAGDDTAAAAIHPGLDRALGAAAADFWRLVAEGGRAELECSGGSARIFDANAWHLGGDDGAPTVVVLRDITTERRNAEGLRTLNTLARELLAESSLDVLLSRIVDAAKDLTRADFSALVTLRGDSTEVEQFVYNAPRELFPARLPRVVGLLAVPIATKQVARIDDIRGHPAGVGIPVEHPPIAALLAAPILSGDEVIGELAVANQPDRPPFDDVDEAILTELAAHGALAVSLVRAREAQHQVAATRRALMDTALHNIRTPLTVAKGFLSTIRRNVHNLSEDELAQSFEAVERAHDRIQALAEGALLDEPVADGATRSKATVLIAELVDALTRDLSGVRGDVDIRWATEPDAPTVFTGDVQVVRELLDNLVSNAVTHAPPGTAVTITVRREGDSIRFDITDKGPGIPPEEQSRVFEQFYRTRQSVAAGTAGTGLGLWIVRRLGDVLGGAVGLSSRPGEGTTFWATFPVGQASEVPTA